MLRVMQAVGIGKVRIDQTQRGHVAVHQVDKFFNAAANRFSDQVGALVAGAHHGGVQQIAEIDFLAHGQRDLGGALLHLQGRFGSRYGLLHIAHQDAQIGGQDLGGGGGVKAGVGVLLIDHHARIGLDQDGGQGVQIGVVQLFGMIGVVIAVGRQGGHAQTGRQQDHCQQQAYQAFQHACVSSLNDSVLL